MKLTREQVEDAIVERITSVVKGTVKVVAWPDDPAEFKNLSEAGCILVRFERAKSQKPPSRGSGQPRTWQFLIVVCSKSLRAENAHHGCYELMDKVEQAMSGFAVGAQPPDHRGLEFYHAEERFVRHEGKKWWYGMVYAADGVHPMY